MTKGYRQASDFQAISNRITADLNYQSSAAVRIVILGDDNVLPLMQSFKRRIKIFKSVKNQNLNGIAGYGFLYIKLHHSLERIHEFFDLYQNTKSIVRYPAATTDFVGLGRQI